MRRKALNNNIEHITVVIAERMRVGDHAGATAARSALLAAENLRRGHDVFHAAMVFAQIKVVDGGYEEPRIPAVRASAPRRSIVGAASLRTRSRRSAQRFPMA